LLEGLVAVDLFQGEEVGEVVLVDIEIQFLEKHLEVIAGRNLRLH
jgi:hypothetical protein